MSGNVSEWVADWLSEYSSQTQSNPTGPVEGSEKLVKGCRWKFIPRLPPPPPNSGGRIALQFPPGLGGLGGLICSTFR